jgi:hypothetical protein
MGRARLNTITSMRGVIRGTAVVLADTIGGRTERHPAAALGQRSRTRRRHLIDQTT